MKVIVTGVNGFIGIHTVRGFIEGGYNVEAVDITTERSKEFSNSKRFVAHEMGVLDEDFKMLINLKR